MLQDNYETLAGNGTFSSVVPDVEKGQAVLLLDSGTSYAYAPEAMVTAMYKNVPGATFDSGVGQCTLCLIKIGLILNLICFIVGQWTVPCDQQVFLGLWIG